MPTRVVCPTQRLGQRTTHQGHRAGGTRAKSKAVREASERAQLPCTCSCTSSVRSECATVLDLSTVVVRVRAVRRGSRRGSQRNGRASRALGARACTSKQRAQCATVLDLSTVGVTRVRGQESQILVWEVRPKMGWSGRLDQKGARLRRNGRSAVSCFTAHTQKRNGPHPRH